MSEEKPKKCTLKPDPLEELLNKHGIPTRDTTLEHLGEMVIVPTVVQKEESDDSAETALRYANQRKGH